VSAVEPFTGRSAARAAVSEQVAGAGDAFHSATLKEQFQIATAISNAIEAVPKGYRKQPGAVLLALAWAQQHELDILTTLQNVAFVNGRAVVDATMQRALAKRAGYDLSITIGADAAVVVLSQGGKELGAATYTMADAEQAELLDKDNWKHNPEDMLVARATTRAIKRHAPEVLLGVLVEDELAGMEPEQDLAGLTSEIGKAVQPGETEPTTTTAPDEPPAPADAGGGATAASSPSPWTTANAMRADLKARGITTPMAVRHAAQLATDRGVEAPVGTLDAIFAYPDPGYVEAFAAWVRNHDLTSE
jgi:hypothetical protein